MDLFDSNQKNEEKNSKHEQLSLDFDLVPEAAPPAEEKIADEKTGISTEAPEKEPAAPKATPEKEKQDAPEIRETPKELPKKDIKKTKSKKNPGADSHLPAITNSFGKYLEDMRVKNGYSINQIEQMTRIKSKYIELLEMEKLWGELPSVYVLAYVRKLCACYKVPVDKTVSILSELKKELEKPFSGELAENVNLDYELDEEGRKKLRHFVWLLLGGVVLFIALVGIAIFILSSPPKSTETSRPAAVLPTEKFNQEKLKVLHAPVIIEAGELPEKNTN